MRLGPGRVRRAGAVTAIDRRAFRDAEQRGLVDVRLVCLAERPAIGLEPKPGEVLEEAASNSGRDSLPIVVLDPQQHVAARGAGQPQTKMALATWPRCR